MMHRLLKVGPDNELLWVRLYVHPYGERWAAMLVSDNVRPPRSPHANGVDLLWRDPRRGRTGREGHTRAVQPIGRCIIS